MVRESLLTAYDLAREDTPLAGATLVIEDVALVVYCAICQTERTIHRLDELCCPVCDTPCGDIRQGRELEIVALEICDR